MRRIHVNAKTWKYESGFDFPENKYFNSTRKNYGIACSGGGCRSASLTIGYLRALHKLNLLNKVKYISGVSGGAWAAIPYTFLDKSIDDEVFLGSFKKAPELTYNDIQMEEKRSFTYTLSETKLLDDLLASGFTSDERFAFILGRLFLSKYLLNDRTKFFTLNEESLNEILSRPENNELRVQDFYTVQHERPYLIAGGILTRSVGPFINRFPFEMTPLYVGIPPYFKNKGSQHKFDLGGGYVESFAFDSDSPENGVSPEGMVNVRIRRKINRFAVSDVMATTGAALAEHLDRLLLNIGFPEFKYWSPRDIQKAKEYDFADGGLLDNSGIMPLLRRKVEKIIVLVNGTSDLVHQEKNGKDEVSTMVKALFMSIDNHWGIKDFSGNIVLTEPGKTGKESYESVRAEFINLNKEGKPAVVKRKYVTIKNDLFDIPSGQEVEIIWIHNAFVFDWYNELTDPDLKAYVEEQRRTKNFPNLSTFFTNGSKIIDLDLPQANIMAHHASYIINSEPEVFKEFFE